tara:strand:+ start:566 stop:715 length:150 start_codon:yes stop_codon:yes gene_type:complete
MPQYNFVVVFKCHDYGAKNGGNFVFGKFQIPILLAPCAIHNRTLLGNNL